METTADRRWIDPVGIDLESLTCPAWISDDSGLVVWSNTVLTERDDEAASIPVVVDGRTDLRLSLPKRQRDMEDASFDRLKSQETEHRARNIVSLAMAIANQSLCSLQHDPAVQSFLDRLQSLSDVTRLGCEVNDERCELGSVARTVMRRFDPTDESRISCAGPETWIPARWAHMLALVVHELGTNAIRHGSLRPGEGRVELEWDVARGPAFAQRTIDLRWVEQGGPPCDAARPDGFGNRMLRGMANAGSRCHADLSLSHEGLRYVMKIVVDDTDMTERMAS